MTKTVTHTPTPKVGDEIALPTRTSHERMEGRRYAVRDILDGTGTIIARSVLSMDAVMISTALNSHDDLVAALRAVLADYQNCDSAGELGATWKANVKAARAALAKATKEQP